MSTKKVVKEEVRWALHIPKNSYREDDYHYVKTVRHFEDGTSEPHVKILTNFQRPIWVNTRPNYKEKKEFEEFDKLTMTTTTQSDLNMTVARMLGKPHLATQAKLIKDSPYVYGYDVSSTSFIKYKSLKENNFTQTEYTVASFDIETTTCSEKYILMATVTMLNKNTGKYFVCIGATNEYLSRTPRFKEKLLMSNDKYLPQYKDKLEIDLRGFDTVTELLTFVFRTCNELAPDILSIWNQNFDIPTCIAAIEREGNKPSDVFCDPKVPTKLRMCRYREGITKKPKAGGFMPLAPSAQWHVFTCTARFLVMDAMCLYRQLRLMEGERSSYSLDYILEYELGSRKLTFKEADAYTQGKWHDFMQENYPVEYMTYNIYDTIALLELDDKTKDICKRLPDFSATSDFWNYNKQSVKLTDALFWFGLSKGLVIGTGGNHKEEDEIDDSLLEVDDEEDDGEERVEDYDRLGLRGWIALLPQANLVTGEGLRIFEDVPYLRSAIRGLTADQDKVSSYPNVTDSCNVSKATCVSEVISVDGVTEDTFRQQNLGIALGGSTILEYYEVMFGMPPIHSRELEDLIDELM